MIELRASLPLNMHPGSLVGSNPSADQARSSMTRLYETCIKIDDLANEVKDKDKLARAAEPVATKAIAAAGAMVETLGDQLAGVNKAIETEITGRTFKSGSIGQDVRAHYKNEKHRLAKIQKVILAAHDGQNREIIGEVLSAPAVLSGLNDRDHQMLKTVAARYVCPEQVERRAQIEKSLSFLNDASDAFVKRTTKQLRNWKSSDDVIIKEKL